MENKLRKSGIGVIGDVPWGTHFCQFYKTKKDLTDILVPYFKAGLENNEFCIWVTSEPLTEKDAAEAMTNVMPDFDRYEKKGQIEIVPHTDWYLKDGALDSHKTIDGWVEKLNGALAKGYDGMRSTGNTFWLVKRDWKNFADYEEDINKIIDKRRMISICTYSLDRCEACEVIDVLHNHESALFRRGREWKLVENSESREKARSEEETRFRLITENARELIMMVNLNGQCIYASPSFKTILGYGTKQFMSMRFTDLIHSEDLGQLPFWQNISLFEFRARKDDGNWIWLEGSSNIVLYNGELAVNIVARDITERKTAEKAIENLSRQNELILNSAGEGIFGLDLSGNHTFVNSAAAQMLGYRVRELIDKPSHKIWHHSKPDGSPYPETECPMYAACKDGIVRRVKNEVFWKKDGTSFPVAYTSTPILEGGKLIGAVVTFRDITERKREEEELKKHRKQLKELVEERTSELRAVNDELQQQILERKRIEEALLKSEENFRAVAGKLRT